MFVGPSSLKRCSYMLGQTTQIGGEVHEKTTKTYNTEDSPVVTDLSTDSAVASLSRGERTGSRALWHLWSYVSVELDGKHYLQSLSRFVVLLTVDPTPDPANATPLIALLLAPSL